MTKKLGNMKLRNRFLVVLLLALLISATLFEESGRLDRQF